jgi:predicted DNA binding CopG/RHH family protein
MARPSTNSRRVNMYLPVKLIAAAKRLAFRRGISFSELVRNAIVQYMRAEIAAEERSEV